MAVPGAGGPIAAHPNGQFVVVTGAGNIRTYAVDKVAGQLSERSAQQAPSGRPFILSLAVAPQQAYVINRSGSIGSHKNWAHYSLDPTTGVLAACVNFCVNGLSQRDDISFLVAAQDGRFVYSNDWRGNVYTSALQPDGSLLDIGAVDLGTITFSASAALGPNFLAVITGDTSDVGAGFLTLAVDPNTGLLSPRQKVAAGDRVVKTVGSTGLIAVRAPSAIETWSVDTAGALTLRGSVPIAAGIYRTLAFDPTSRFLYASGTNGILVLAVDSSGALRTLPTYPSGDGEMAVISR
jgi:6-phosphogluconolactonase (cycloisomerase 2 family)